MAIALRPRQLPRQMLHQVAQVALPEDREVLETLGSDRPHESFSIAVAVRTLLWNGRALHAARLEQLRPCPREQRIPIVDQVARFPQEPVHRIEQIARHRLGGARFAEAAREGTQAGWSQLVTVTLAA